MGVLYRSVQHSKNTSHNNLPLFRKGITESISLCVKHSNNWKEVTYPYFSASSLASSSFTILWSSRSLLFPHNTMSGFSQYACICSWPNRNNMNRSHDLLSHTALQEYYCFRKHNDFHVKWLSERERNCVICSLSRLLQLYWGGREQVDATITRSLNKLREQKPVKASRAAVYL